MLSNFSRNYIYCRVRFIAPYAGQLLSNRRQAIDFVTAFRGRSLSPYCTPSSVCLYNLSYATNTR